MAMGKARIIKWSIFGTLVLVLLAGCFANEFMKCTEARAKERSWNERVSRDLPLTLPRADAQRVLEHWSLSPFWNDPIRELSAFIPGKAGCFLQSYSLRIVLVFDLSDKLIKAEVQRVYRNWI